MLTKTLWLQSAVITSIVIVLFGLFVIDNDNSKFKLSYEYQLVPEGFVLPQGCDIRIDMQSGETWAKKHEDIRPSSIVVVQSEVPTTEESTAPSNKKSARPYPEYKNLTKNRIQSRLSGETIGRLEAALNSLDQEDSWEFLEEEAPAIEFGLALFESKSFPVLRTLIIMGNNDRALGLIAMCLQNNPLAIEKFIELKVDVEIVEILKKEELESSTFMKVLRILESTGIEFESELVKRHAKKHELSERYTEFITNLQ